MKLTIGIIAMNLTVHIFRGLLGVSVLRYSALVVGGEPYQWSGAVTYMWLHNNTGHLIGNLFVGLVIIGLLEHLIGWKKAGIIYLTSGIVAGLMYLELRTGTHYATGMSGALWGCIGALLITTMMQRRYILFGGVLVYLIYGVYITETLTHINSIGHYTGLIAGILATLMIKNKGVNYEKKQSGVKQCKAIS